MNTSEKEIMSTDRLTKNQGNLVIAVYSHPETLPPTLNAIKELSSTFEKLSVVYRPFVKTEWKYPENVKLVPSGAPMSAMDQENSNIAKKFWLFFQFTRRLLKEVKKNKPTWVLVYDQIPTFSLILLKPLMSNKIRLWYHNHDIYASKHLKKFSLSWFALKAEKSLLGKIDMFTLPSEERKKYFDLKDFMGQYFMIPNFPSKNYVNSNQKSTKSNTVIRLIFQGSIGSGHGIEEIIRLLPLKINNKNVKLVLKGFLRPDYEKTLKKLVNRANVIDEVEFIGLTPYQEIAKITCSCHIGIAIFSKNDIMNQTLGTASNKIYEYAACSLPILYYNNAHFAHHLGHLNWAFGTDVSDKSLISSIEEIDNNYDQLSASAKKSYLEDLNFEHHFQPVVEFLNAN